MPTLHSRLFHRHTSTNADKPREERLGFLEPLQGELRSNECLLRDFLGLGNITQTANKKRYEWRLVLLNKPSVCIRMAIETKLNAFLVSS